MRTIIDLQTFSAVINNELVHYVASSRVHMIQAC